VLAHLLTALRLALLAPFAYWMYSATQHAALLAAAALVAAIASDLLDGAIARRRGTQSSFGRAFDHGADCAFVSAGLAGAAARGSLPWLLPALVVVAFAQYAIDSYWLHRRGELRMSALGRWNGVLYFVPLSVDVARRLGIEVPLLALHVIAWLLIASTVASMADRALALRGAS
jgi:CDP-diacylglycerol--glycerol-3-phosphate 3-phosphatidyltransferase